MAEQPVLDPKMYAETPDANGLVWYPLPCAPFAIYGACDVNPFRRLPQDVADATSAGVSRQATQTAGIRVRFATDSSRVGIRAKMPYVTKFCHMPLTGSSSFDVYEDSEGGSRFQNLFKPAVDISDGFEMSVKLFGGKKTRFLTVNLPLYSPVDTLEIGLEAGSILAEGKKYRNLAPIVYYGSSITQGACASRPGLCYEAIISRRMNIDHINLGFSGNARGEEAIVNYMAGLSMSAFVSDYDHNAPSDEHLLATHLPMYLKIREKHPDIPYIMVSAPDFFLQEDLRTRRRRIIEDSFRFARAQGDKNVYYVDGEGFSREAEEDNYTTDGTHPNDSGFLKMADGIERILVRAMRRIGED